MGRRGGAGPAAAVQGGGAGKVHDVDRRAGAGGQADGRVDGGNLGVDRPGVGEVTDRAAAGLDQLAAGPLQHVRVLAVHEGDRPGPPGRGDDLGQAGSARREAGIRQEHLDARVPAGGQGGDLRQLGVAQAGEHGMQEPVDGGLGARAGHIPGDGLGHGLPRQRERHVAEGGDPAGDGGQRAGPEVVGPDRLARLRGGHLRGELSAHQVHVGIDAAGDHQQAAGVDLPSAGHGPAELGDLAAGDAHVGLLPVTRRHDRAVADNEVKTLLCHPGILARRYRQGRWPGPVCGPPSAGSRRPGLRGIPANGSAREGRPQTSPRQQPEPAWPGVTRLAAYGEGAQNGPLPRALPRQPSPTSRPERRAGARLSDGASRGWLAACKCPLGPDARSARRMFMRPRPRGGHPQNVFLCREWCAGGGGLGLTAPWVLMLRVWGRFGWARRRGRTGR